MYSILISMITSGCFSRRCIYPVVPIPIRRLLGCSVAQCSLDGDRDGAT